MNALDSMDRTGGNRAGTRLPAMLGPGTQAMGAATPAIDLLASTLAILRRWLLPIALIAVVGTAAVGVLLGKTPSRYTAAVDILIEPRDRVDFGNLEENSNYQRNPISPADMETYARIAGAEKILLGVLDRVGSPPESGQPGIVSQARSWLAEGFPRLAWLAEGEDAPATAAKQREDQLKALRRNLTIARDPIAHVLTVSYHSTEPEYAATVINTLSALFLEELIAADRSVLAQSASFLEQQREMLRTRLEDAEHTLRQFQNDHNLIDVQGASGADLAYAELSRELITAQAALAQAEARLAQVDAPGGGTLSGITESFTSPMLADLMQRSAEADRHYAELTSSLGRRHPRVVDAARARDEARAGVRREMERMENQVRGEREVAAARVAGVQARLTLVEKQIALNNGNRVKLEDLQSQADAARRLYEMTLDRAQRASVQQALVHPAARVLGEARVPVEPDGRKRAVIVPLAFVGFTALGCGLAFLVEILRRGYDNVAELATGSGALVVGSLPLVRGSATNVEADDTTRELSAALYAEAIRRLALRLRPADEPGGSEADVVLVTSALPHEGKTTLALCMARQMHARHYRVLVIDADLHRRQLTTRLGMRSLRKVGLHDLLVNRELSAMAAIRHHDHFGFSILPANATPAGFRIVDHGHRVAAILREVREHFDVVIIDSPPVMAVSDYGALAGCVDRTLMMVDWRRTRRGAVRAALHELSTLQGELPWLVLNRIPLRHLLSDEGHSLGYVSEARRRRSAYAQRI